MNTETRPSGRINRALRAERRLGTKEVLVRCGVEIFSEKGFQATGIDEIRQRVNVPKGSFYHFFASKHDFGLAVIDAYAAYFDRKLAKFFDGVALVPLDRLTAFVRDAMRGMQKYDFQRGCLVGNLGQELGGLDDIIRARLEAILQSWQLQTARVLEEAIAQGHLPKDADSAALANFFWIGWEGAILRAKLTQNNDPLQQFYGLFLKTAGVHEQVLIHAKTTVNLPHLAN